MFRFLKRVVLKANRINSNRGMFTVIQKSTSDQTLNKKLFVLSSLSCSLLLFSNSNLIRKQISSSDPTDPDPSRCAVVGNAEHEGVVHYEINKPIGDEEFKEYLETVRSAHPESPIFVLFMGNKCPQKGEHWCRDCLVAEPIITQEVAKCSSKRTLLSSSASSTPSFSTPSPPPPPPPPLVLVTCAVCRDFMKPTSPYRLNPDIKLTSVPCLIKWNFDKKASSPSKIRLNDYECKRRQWVRHFLEQS